MNCSAAVRLHSGADLDDYFENTHMPTRLVGCSRDTIGLMRVALILWNRWPGHRPLHQITSRTLADFSAWLLPGRSPASVNTYLRRIMAILRAAAEDGELPAVPRYRKLRELIRAPLAFTKDEFCAVLRIAYRQPGVVGGIRANLWWPSFLSVEWETGLRVRAQLSITHGDLLLDQCGLFCQAEAQKDREADWYPLSPDTIQMVRLIYDPRRKLVWPSNVSLDCLRRRLRRMMDDAAIYAPRGSGMVFHRTRRSCASYVAVAGGNPTRKLGHSSPQITARYLDPRIVRSARNTDLVPAPSVQ